MKVAPLGCDCSTFVFGFYLLIYEISCDCLLETLMRHIFPRGGSLSFIALNINQCVDDEKMGSVIRGKFNTGSHVHNLSCK